ncbi:metallopeptidase family protein [Jatrophihabitans sp.]|uniref:metallopeptidase family protein n=1 Tax=Jatrophihabitans sp. TaxID=1932789 RepID=UPI0030C73E9A
MRSEPRGPRPDRPAGTGRRRDRRGRGLRGEIAAPTVPRSRTRSERFDDLILNAVEELEAHWSAELSGLEFAVEDVPNLVPGEIDEFDPEIVLDRGVPLARLMRTGVEEIPAPTIIVYRRPIEARATAGEDRSDLVFMIVAELVAEFLGRDIDEIDPPRS